MCEPTELNKDCTSHLKCFISTKHTILERNGSDHSLCTLTCTEWYTHTHVKYFSGSGKESLIHWHPLLPMLVDQKDFTEQRFPTQCHKCPPVSLMPAKGLSKYPFKNPHCRRDCLHWLGLSYIHYVSLQLQLPALLWMPALDTNSPSLPNSLDGGHGVAPLEEAVLGSRGIRKLPSSLQCSFPGQSDQKCGGQLATGMAGRSRLFSPISIWLQA